MEQLKVIKLGGKILSDPIKLEKALISFSKVKGKKILIHGGGSAATSLAERMGVEVKMIEGRRITDKDMLEIVTMVYGGLLNKNIVAKLQSLHTNALGLSGADGNIIEAIKRPVKEVDYGFVGDIKRVNKQHLSTLLKAKFTPVVCALTHDGLGMMLNTNADTIASDISSSMSKDFDVELLYAFEFRGVLSDINDKDSVISKINAPKFEKMKQNGMIADGMIPKIFNAINASAAGVGRVFICDYLNLETPEQSTEICQ